MTIEELDALVKAVCPIHGLNSNGVIWFKPEATTDQRLAAQAVVATHLSELTP